MYIHGSSSVASDVGGENEEKTNFTIASTAAASTTRKKEMK